MCLLFFAYKMSPKFELVLAANRDEFLNRPTAPLRFLDSGEEILGGRDLRGGGTWLALSGDGKVGAITNYRDPSLMRVNAPSRGELIINYLQSQNCAEEYLEQLKGYGRQYDGFNLILGDQEGLYYYSNVTNEVIQLEPGYYGLSNHFLDTPWPKVVRGKAMLKAYLSDIKSIDSRTIFSLLRDTEEPSDEMLPDTGVGMIWERLLSTIFIDGPGYGTRSSALIVKDESGCTFLEKSYLRGAGKSRTSTLVEMSFKR
jgi:uncharacterized protein with NRDE domain